MRIESNSATEHSVQHAFREALTAFRSQRETPHDCGASPLAHAMIAHKHASRESDPTAPAADLPTDTGVAAEIESRSDVPPGGGLPASGTRHAHPLSNIAESAFDELAELIDYVASLDFGRDRIGRGTIGNADEREGRSGAAQSRGESESSSLEDGEQGVDASILFGSRGALKWLSETDENSIYLLRKIVGRAVGRFRNVDDFLRNLVDVAKVYAYRKARTVGESALPALEARDEMPATGPDTDPAVVEYLVRLTEFLNEATKRRGRRVGWSRNQGSERTLAPSSGPALPHAISDLRDAVVSFQTVYLLAPTTGGTHTAAQGTRMAAQELYGDPAYTRAERVYVSHADRLRAES